MRKSNYKILSIIPGAKHLGIAIFEDINLQDWFIKVFINKSIDEKIKLITSFITQLIEKHEISILAIKIIHPSRSSPNLSKIISAIRVIGKKSHVTISEFTITEMKQLLGKELQIDSMKNKKILMEEVVTLYPFLFGEADKEKMHKNKYYTRMFEAVALGVVCYGTLNENETG